MRAIWKVMAMWSACGLARFVHFRDLMLCPRVSNLSVGTRDVLREQNKPCSTSGLSALEFQSGCRRGRMRRNWLLFPLILLGFSLNSLGQSPSWSGILASSRAVDWSSAGIPGGIPSGSWTQSGSTILASTYGNGSSDASAGINSALASCGTNHFVQLGSGTFRINSAVGVPSNCALRGSGANSTIIQCYVTTSACIYGGQNTGGGGDIAPSLTDSTSINGGSTAGSTSITVAGTAGMTVGGYLLVTQLNDSTYVSNSAAANNGGSTCTWCDGGIGWNGTRVQGQIVEITSISGTTIGITSGGAGAATNPGLYYGYNNTPLAVPFSAAAKYAGIEALQVYAENTGAAENFYLGTCMYCWVDGVESNYTDGNWAEIDWGFHDQISNSYMSNAFTHSPGTNDSNICLRTYTSGSLVQNNILERGHAPLMVEWGVAGSVLAYNYILGQYDLIDFQSGSTNTVNPCGPNNPCANMPAVDAHGANPQFNLVEGNVASIFEPDNIWGSSTWFTTFRNWWQGTTKMCSNGNAGGLGRGTVNCSGSAGAYSWQISNAYEIEAFSTRNNLVADAVGGAQQQALLNTQGGSLLGQVLQTTGQCGLPACGASSRLYGTNADAFSFGYFSVSSTGGGPYDTLAPYSTAFIHGVYTNMNDLITWNSGTTQDLPASFYLSGKPSWWTASAYPDIGPDVTGGAGAGGHASLIPAQVCYAQVMGGTDGSGSPLSFNAANCYGSGTTSQAPQPPTGLSASVQ